MVHAAQNKRMYTSEFQKKQTSEACSGELNNFSILNDIKVVKIREMYKNGTTQSCLALIYGVNYATIHYIVKNKTWKHLL